MKLRDANDGDIESMRTNPELWDGRYVKIGDRCGEEAAGKKRRREFGGRIGLIIVEIRNAKEEERTPLPIKVHFLASGSWAHLSEDGSTDDTLLKVEDI